MVAATPACPIHVVGKRIQRGGKVVFRDPQPGTGIPAAPACGRGTVSLWATHDGVRTFRRDAVPSLTGAARLCAA